MEAGDTATLATTDTPATDQQTPTTGPPASESSVPSSPETKPAISSSTGQPITQAEVDQLRDIITREVNDRSNFMRQLDRARTPLGLVHHGIGAYTVVCDDGTAWRLHGDDWEQFRTPIPGTRADLVAQLSADAEKRAAEAKAASSQPATAGDSAGTHVVAVGSADS